MTVYRKTPKGMDELLARSPSIDSRVFGVLVLVDGVRDSSDIIQLAKDADLPLDALEILRHGGYLEQRFRGSPTPARPAAAAPPAPPSVSAATAPAAPAPSAEAPTGPIPYASAPAASTPPPAPELAARGSIPVGRAARFQSFHNLYAYLVEQTKALLGLRGFGYQLRIERASATGELQELIKPLSEAIAKKHGFEVAQNFKREGDLLALTARAEQEFAGMHTDSKGLRNP